MSDLNYVIGDYGQTTASTVYPTTIQSATITTSGGPVQITVTGDGEPNDDGWQRLQIFRNSTAIGEILHVETPGSGYNIVVAMSHIDTPVAGTYTYSVRVVNGSGLSITYTEAGQLSMIVEEKMGGNAISNNWLRRDIGSPDTYYGYSFDYNVADSDTKWSIKKVTVSGSVETVTWSNGKPGAQISIWNDRVECFSSPAGSLNLSVSQLNLSGKPSIGLSWDLITGVNVYQIIISESVSGNTLTDGGYVLNNRGFNSMATAEVYNVDNYVYSHPQVGVTYSVTVKAVNIAGDIIETDTILI